MKPILIIQAGDLSLESPLYYEKKGGYYEIFTRTGCLDGLPVEIVNISGGEQLPSYTKISAAIITGSAALINQKLKWSETCAEWIRKTLPTGLPILGICYGHQLIAHALGGTIGKNRYGPEYGSTKIKLLPEAIHDPLFNGAPILFYIQSAHFETVAKLPVGATLLAQNESGGTEAVRYTNTCWGIQFHPEFNSEDMRLFITDPDEGLHALGINIDRLVEQLRPTPFGPILLNKFTQLVAEGGITF